MPELLQRLDMYIWELAVKQLRDWKGTEKQNLNISVNMSAKDFYSIDVYDVLTKLTEKYGVDCKMLRLVITETERRFRWMSLKQNSTRCGETCRSV